MLLVNQSIEVENINGIQMLKDLEKIGRVCYKSEDKITDISHIKFIQMLIKREHGAMLEHSKITCKVICSRAIANELVRHRIASFAQESTRYCNYGGDDITFIIPEWVTIEPGKYTLTFGLDDINAYNSELKKDDAIWLNSCLNSEKDYNQLILEGKKPQEAREVLNNSLKTEIYITTNIREWRHIFGLRLDKAAHPQMRLLMAMIYDELSRNIPIVFEEFNHLRECITT